VLPLSPDEAAKRQTAWAEYLGRKPVEDNVLGMKLVLVPPGELDLGPDGRMVISRPYWLGQYEVTRRQFAQFVAAGKHVTFAEKAQSSIWMSLREPDAPGRNFSTYIETRNGLNWQTPGYANPGDEDAVVHVSWDDAVAFCRWLSEKEGRSYRLPREAEWSWAHHAGDAADRPPGAPAGTVESVRERSLRPMRPGPVGQDAPNAWGLHDMSDNVSEWCRDWWSPTFPPGRHVDYEYATNLTNNIRARRVHVRRGSSFAAVAFHYALRLPNPGESTRSDLGFRVLCEVAD
jgi:formylglycine-generating enzyme required for sulfatase activity